MALTVCKWCDCEMDEEVCWCGTLIKDHYTQSDCTYAIPMGCRCYVDKKDTRNKHNMSKADTIRVTKEQIEHLEKKILAHQDRISNIVNKLSSTKASLNHLLDLLHKKEDFLSTLEEADDE